MGWLIALAVILGIGVLPLGVSALYGEAGPFVRLIIGPLILQVYPAKKKAAAKGQSHSPNKGMPSAKADAGSKASKGGKLSDFIPIVQTILDFLGDFRRKIRVNRLEMKLTLAGDDPCDLAVHYGQAWAALGSLEPQLDRLLIIKKKDLQIQCDFEETQSRISARLDLTVTVGRLLSLTARYGFRALREFQSIMKLRKGGAVK